MSPLEISKILIVDDTEFNIDIIVDALDDLYDIRVAMRGADALELVELDPPDLILLDISMPEMDGFEVCSRLKDMPSARNIPIIFISANSHLESKMRAFDLGGVDYIVKPFDIKEIQSRIKTQLELKYSRELLSDENHNLAKLVRIKTNEVIQMRSAIIQTLASLAETRDDDTGHHILRTQHYVRIMLEYMLEHKIYGDLLTNELAEVIILATPLHDIGKIGIPDAILLKPGHLTTEEFEIMKTHTLLGKRSLEVAQKATNNNFFFEVAKEIAHYHHEKWDGTGYPEGLSHEQIPLSARLVAVADVYDALVTKRVYKDPISHNMASKVIIKGFANHFDPTIVDVFLQKIDDFHLIATKFGD
jgi:putative two-component system response regulator